MSPVESAMSSCFTSDAFSASAPSLTGSSSVFPSNSERISSRLICPVIWSSSFITSSAAFASASALAASSAAFASASALAASSAAFASASALVASSAARRFSSFIRLTIPISATDSISPIACSKSARSSSPSISSFRSGRNLICDVFPKSEFPLYPASSSSEKSKSRSIAPVAVRSNSVSSSSSSSKSKSIAPVSVRSNSDSSSSASPFSK